MSGPPPKHQSVRARVNKASTRATLEERRDGVKIPPLPKVVDPASGQPVAWHPMTIAWWNDIWPSPMSMEWHSSDIHGLYRLAMLIDKFWYADSLKAQREASAEIRLVGQCYGLNPLDRRKLEWTIGNVEKVQRENERAQPPAQTPASSDGKPDLRLVVE
jgi:hypothetical protein